MWYEAQNLFRVEHAALNARSIPFNTRNKNAYSNIPRKVMDVLHVYRKRSIRINSSRNNSGIFILKKLTAVKLETHKMKLYRNHRKVNENKLFAAAEIEYFEWIPCTYQPAACECYLLFSERVLSLLGNKFFILLFSSCTFIRLNGWRRRRNTQKYIAPHLKAHIYMKNVRCCRNKLKTLYRN